MKPFIKSLIINIVGFLIAWPLLEMLWTKLISHAEFQYNVSDHVILPIGAAAIFTVLDYCIFKRKKRKQSK